MYVYTWQGALLWGRLVKRIGPLSIGQPRCWHRRAAVAKPMPLTLAMNGTRLCGADTRVCSAETRLGALPPAWEPSLDTSVEAADRGSAPRRAISKVQSKWHWDAILPHITLAILLQLSRERTAEQSFRFAAGAGKIFSRAHCPIEFHRLRAAA